MHLLKGSLVLILLLTLLLILGCSNKDNGYDKDYIIKEEDIYNQIDDEYYVYFYKNDCPYCDDVYQIINEYINKSQEKNLTKLYVCDLSDQYLITYNIYYENNLTYIKLLDGNIFEYDESVLQLSKEKNKYICTFKNGNKSSFSIEKDNIKIDDDYILKIEKVEDLLIESKIKRAYQGENGQGSKGTYFVNGVTKYCDLYISGVPSIIKINNDDISTFMVSGRKYIKEFIEEQIK